jgi:hypothetical protein
MATERPAGILNRLDYWAQTQPTKVRALPYAYAPRSMRMSTAWQPLQE